MSLKGDRLEVETLVDYFNNGTALTRGGVSVFTGFGSGGALDQSQATVGYVANSSGQYPVGLQLNDIVNIDLTRQHINYYRDEAIIGSKAVLGRKGWWVTNSIIQGVAAPAQGDVAVLTSSGNIMNLPGTIEFGGSVWNKAVNPKVGRFMSGLDEDGYAKVEINLPN